MKNKAIEHFGRIKFIKLSKNDITLEIIKKCTHCEKQPRLDYNHDEGYYYYDGEIFQIIKHEFEESEKLYVKDIDLTTLMCADKNHIFEIQTPLYFYNIPYLGVFTEVYDEEVLKLIDEVVADYKDKCSQESSLQQLSILNEIFMIIKEIDRHDDEKTRTRFLNFKISKSITYNNIDIESYFNNRKDEDNREVEPGSESFNNKLTILSSQTLDN